MESKTKHRILGLVVVGGLAVLAYPFIQGSSNITKEQVSVKAPPFPDQAIQVTANDETSAITPPDMSSSSAADATLPNASSPELPVPSDSADKQDDAHIVNIAAQAAATPDTAAPATDAVTPAVTPTPDAASAPKPDAAAAEPATGQPAMPSTPEAAPAKPADSDKSSPAPSPSSLNSSNEDAAPIAEEIIAKPKKKVALTKRQAVTVAPVLLSKLTSAAAIKANKHKPLDNNGLLQLKQAAYVIQLGSFKEKANALKLVNKLRAQGYRAFIQHAVVASGENTRVFVGPEHKQASARIVASELENKMKLHGIVVSYKPFTL